MFCSSRAMLLPLMLLMQPITTASAEKIAIREAKTGQEILLGSYTIVTGCVTSPAKQIVILANPQFGTVDVRPLTTPYGVDSDTGADLGNCGGKPRNYLAIYYKALVADKATDFIRVKASWPTGLTREETFRVELNTVRLGISTQPVRQEIADKIGLGAPRGVMVTDITKDSAAMAAGIVAGDVVLAIDDEKTNDVDELVRKIRGLRTNDTADATIWRDGGEKHILVRFGNGGIQRNSSGAAAAPQPQAQPSARDTQAPNINAPKPLND